MSDPHPDDLDELLTLPELAAIVRAPLSTMYHWRAEGYGPPARRVGKRLLYRRGDVLDWVNSLPVTTGSAARRTTP